MSKRSASGDVKMTRTVSYAPPVYKKKRKQFAKRSSKGPSPQLRAYIKSTISSMAEKKCVIAHGENVAVGSTSGSVPNAIALAPTISQGTSQNQRVGNQVKVTSAMVRGNIMLLPIGTLNVTGPPILVKMWLCRYRLANPSGLAATDIATGFFDTGAGVTGLQGNMYDIDAFINNDSWELISEKVVRLSAASGTASIPSTTVGVYYDNGSATVPFRFDFGKRLGTLLFNDTTTVPTNKNLFLIFQPVFANGNSGGSTAVPCELNFQYKCEYTDV